MKRKMEKEKIRLLLPGAFIVSLAVNILFLLNISFIENNGTDNNRKLLEQVLKLQKQQVIGNFLAKKKNTDTGIEPEDGFDKTDAGEAVLQQEIRKLLKDELKDVIAEIRSDTGYENDNSNENNEKPEESQVSKEKRIESYEKTMVLVHNAIDSGRWTQSDTNQARRYFHLLSREQLEEVYKKVYPAINNGDLKMEARDIF
ncbi:MAG: hypothetical protein GY754_24310 [bacterium]|nr:hypothetical protein [bacterium]